MGERERRGARTTPPRTGRGRTRDPSLTPRALAAARAEYGRAGWASFTLDAVARRAGVGKAALYRRWPTKERLLADAIAEHAQPPPPADTGGLRSDTRALAAALLDHFLAPSGRVTLRVAVDAATGLEAFVSHQERIARAHRDGVRDMVGRAVERGELPPGVDTGTFGEALYGTVLAHAMGLGPHERERVREHVDEHAFPLADFVLTALPGAVRDRAAGERAPEQRSPEEQVPEDRASGHGRR
ncbi:MULTISPECIES: TetR/AcrR family transcriptional regulator [unclassified Nocardiopsis]|uniref:TetR/AcrR family transcriptional regulator n=1 Tax=unclassified Nocardiopsis TaxID=2649073 RepID=UPI0013596AC0|nr:MULTISPECIES: TetR/AcrR family transcriptional regulator [unclassified Nocardiopsis]